MIAYVATARNDITIDNSSPALSTIDCETSSLSKAIEVVSRRTELEELENSVLFDRTTWDMIGLNTGYNGDQHVSHFQC